MTNLMKPVTAGQLGEMKKSGMKITMITAYDYPSAELLDHAGIDMILVGDSLGSVIQGRENTLSVTLDQMVYHVEMVARAVRRAMVVADIPFPYAQLGSEEAVRASARILKETGAKAVKIEGGAKRAHIVRAIVEAGIPVVGHCGLMPQDIRKLGGYKVARDETVLEEDLMAIQASGAFAVVLECVPREIAGRLTQKLTIPTIGIGAGGGCDGQVLVFHDILGYHIPGQRCPKHAHAYANLGETIMEAVARFSEDVRNGRFPTEAESF